MQVQTQPTPTQTPLRPRKGAYMGPEIKCPWCNKTDEVVITPLGGKNVLECQWCYYRWTDGEVKL